jgi:hypothetical protein
MKQPSLRGHDVIVAIKVALINERSFTYASLAQDLGLAQSQVHSSLRLLNQARLVHGSAKMGASVPRRLLCEFLVHGVPYFFPPAVSGPTSGVRTNFALDDPEDRVVQAGDVFVWPDASATERGLGILPLHTCVPRAVLDDLSLHRVLSALDTLRVGSAREREIATDFIFRVLG